MSEQQAEAKRTYNHLYYRVEYPAERGYRMETCPLPDWIHLTITEYGDSKRLTVHSRIHVNKSVPMDPIYSNQFTDQEIIKDLSGKISHAFL
jgi:hypothetical protein